MYLVNVVIAKGYLHFPTKFVGLWDVQRTTKSVWGGTKWGGLSSE
jgi:hypothetical protein